MCDDWKELGANWLEEHKDDLFGIPPDVKIIEKDGIYYWRRENKDA